MAKNGSRLKGVQGDATRNEGPKDADQSRVLIPRCTYAILLAFAGLFLVEGAVFMMVLLHQLQFGSPFAALVALLPLFLAAGFASFIWNELDPDIPESEPSWKKEIL